MPTIINNGLVSYVVGNIRIDPGATEIASCYPDPELTDLEVVSDDPRSGAPVLLYEGLTGGLDEGLAGLAAYAWIRITNDSGDILDVTLNGDSANNLHYLQGASDNLDNRQKQIDRITTLGGSGTSGNVYVWGFPWTHNL